MEAVSRPPSFWERVTHNRRLYLKVIRAALLDKAKSGRLVYHGLAGHLLLQDTPAVLRVRVIAPMGKRVEAAMAAQQLTRDEALHHIRKVDEDRIHWAKFLYHVEWGDPSLFDIVVNLEEMTVETATAMIATVARSEEFTCGPDCTEQRTNLALAARVEAALEVNQDTRAVEVLASVEKETLRLVGKVETEALRAQVLAVAKEVVGEMSVSIIDETSVQSLSRYPT